MKNLTHTEKTKHFLLSLLFLFLFVNLSQGQMSKGGIMVIGFDGDGISAALPDHIVLAVLEPIPNGEVIYLTDNEWDGTGWDSTGEGEYTWTNDTGSEIVAGTIVTITVTTDAISGGVGSLIETGSGNFSLSTSGDEVIVYQGSGPEAIPTNFITSFASGPDADNVLTGTGLTNGVDAIDANQFTDDDAIMYNGSLDCSGGDLVACSTMLATPANYVAQDGSGDQSEDGVFPDFPDDIPSSGSFNPPVLPITLNWFEARVNQSNKVDIAWQTAIEINNDYVAIEHRGENTRDFRELTQIKGTGNSYKLKDYAWTHENPSQGVNYYRLVQYDYDGAREVHPESSVFVNMRTSMKIYPSTIENRMYIDFGEETLSNTIRIHDYSGQLIENIITPEDQRIVEIDCSEYKPGIYTVLRYGEFNKEYVKVIKI